MGFLGHADRARGHPCLDKGPPLMPGVLVMNVSGARKKIVVAQREQSAPQCDEVILDGVGRAKRGRTSGQRDDGGFVDVVTNGGSRYRVQV